MTTLKFPSQIATYSQSELRTETPQPPTMMSFLWARYDTGQVETQDRQMQ